MAFLGNRGSRLWALQHGPEDEQMAFEERILKKGVEVKTLRVACIRAVQEQGAPFAFGACLREQVRKKLLSRAVDFSWIDVYWGLVVYIRRRPSVRRFR